MPNSKSQDFQQLISLLFEVSRSAALHGDVICQKFGQSSARWRILLYITKGYSTVSAIAKATNVSRQATQRIADELLKEGLISYSAHLDRRTQTIELTSRGQITVKQMQDEFLRHANRISSKIEEDTVINTIKSLRLVNAVIENDLREVSLE